MNTTELMYDIIFYKMIPGFLQESVEEVKSGLGHGKTFFLKSATVVAAQTFYTAMLLIPPGLEVT